jgi:hypothetical protein
MSPDTIELCKRAEAVRAESAELRAILEHRLRTLRSLCRSLGTTRPAAVMNPERAARHALADQSDLES